MNDLSKQRLAILIVGALGALATFMPWVKLPLVGSINGTHGDGWITFILFTITIVVTLLNDRSKPLAGLQLYGAIVPGIIAGIIGLWKIIDFNNSMSKESLGGDNPFAQALSDSISIGFGLYLIVIVGILLPVVAFMVKDNQPKNDQLAN